MQQRKFFIVLYTEENGGQFNRYLQGNDYYDSSHKHSSFNDTDEL